ncbi:MAG: 3-deoxy-D-manno-octulosonic acid kinase [Gammaproteobacteria bacterium]
MVKTWDKNSQLVRSGNCYILYDASLISKPNQSLFDPQWLQQHAQLKHIAHGRGEAWFVDYEQQHWVLRRYMRGGLVAKFNKSHYFAASMNQTRAWKEWQLLAELYAAGLPVPRPVAAQVCWRVINTGFYQAYLLLEKIPGAKTLSERLQLEALDEVVWNDIGRVVRQFHDQGVYHADLNANNILFSDAGKIYLIDFDRGDMREPGTWKQENISRLHRSLTKLKGIHGVYHFTDSDWQTLLTGYSV